VAKRQDNVAITFNFLLSKGLTPAQAAGAVGGLMGESGVHLDPKAKNPTSGATGVGQWLGGRLAALMAKPNPLSLKTQLDHLWEELEGPERGAYKQLKSAKTIDEATDAWVRGFERPSAGEIASSIGTRKQYARNVFNSSKNFQGAAAPSNGATGAVSTAGTAEAPSVANTAPDLASVQLLAQALQPAPQIQSTPPPAPAFSAAPTLPQGYQQAQSSAPVAPKQDIGQLVAAASAIQGQSASTPSAAPASTPASADVASPNTGPMGDAAFGKSHSPLFELIHNGAGGKAFAVKNGKAVDPSVYRSVWAGHANHVHVAAGPNTIVALGKLAQQMGLQIGGNVYFTGKQDTGGHADQSYHYRRGRTKSGKVADEAIDVSGDPRKMNLYAQRVQSLYGLG
jgi:tail lysozyme